MQVSSTRTIDYNVSFLISIWIPRVLIDNKILEPFNSSCGTLRNNHIEIKQPFFYENKKSFQYILFLCTYHATE